MAKYTPAPWRIEINNDENANWSDQWPRIVSDNYEIVGNEGLYGDFETDMANARLIAAAPDLLGFAEEVRRSGDARLANMALSVIAKAIDA